MRALQGFGFLCWATALTAVCWVLGMLAWLLDPVKHRVADWVLRGWGRALLWGAGVRVVVEGRERLAPGTARVLVCNHASWFDPPLLGAVSPGPVRFVLKQELIRLPFVGWHAWLTGHFLIDRDDPRAGMALLERAVASLARNPVNAVVFPEGTRSADGRLGPLRGGAVQLAMASGLDLQPLAILGSFHLWPRQAALPRRGGTITVRVGPVIPVAGARGGPGRRALTEAVRSALLGLGVPAPSAAPAPGPAQGPPEGQPGEAG